MAFFGLDMGRGLAQSELSLPPLRAGDIIFRMGLNGDSAVIAHISHSEFSHVGLLLSPTQIIEANGDHIDKNDAKVRIVSLNDFISKS